MFFEPGSHANIVFLKVSAVVYMIGTSILENGLYLIDIDIENGNMHKFFIAI
ncbi:MAG: hypothetical protein ACTHJT_01390 [Cytophaga sp.]|uniref:hypothetical protein n=1 Tax=Cytophaga sp. TaxID=29535 RepID=UPI003F8028C6